MAWRSSGTDNTEMVDKLTRFGVITSDHVENGFRRVDRKFFVPRGNESIAHSDQPLKQGNVHISAPHIYGSAIEALDLIPNSALSFLNIGSGTGYISCVVAEILGPDSLNYGIELHDDVIEHCKTSIAKWRPATVQDANGGSTFRFVNATTDIHIIKGNGLNIVKSMGEGVVGFDRIYIGAAVDKEDLANIIELLSPGGILVGPVDDELVKVVRDGVIARRLEEDMEVGDEDLSDLNEEFTSQILSGVRFAPLAMSPVINTVIPSNVWRPSNQRSYPSEFKRATMQLLMCSNSDLVQPIRLPSEDERVNASALLPRTIWLEILSYTHRKWFQPEQNETEYLKQRLRQEKAKVLKAEKARKEAEARCLAAERERTVYRLLALQCQSRLLRSQNQGSNPQQQDAANDLFDLLNLVDGFEETAIADLQFANPSTVSDLRAMLQQLAGNAGYQDEDEQASVGDAGVEDMEEDDASENEDYLSEDEHDYDFDEDGSVDEEQNGDNPMEDADIMVETSQHSDNQPRSVSVSSADL